MIRARCFISLLVLSVFLFVSAAPSLGASEYEDALAKSMRDALVKTGMQSRKAESVTQQYVFFGILMLNDVQRQLLDKDQEKLHAQAMKVGAALGTALGHASNVYGDKKMQETPAVMMLAARAGINPEAAAETFGAFAQNGYAFEAAVQTLHEAAESVRGAKFADAGAGLLRSLRKIAAQKGSIQDLQKEIVAVAKAEKVRQQALIAKNEKERLKRESNDNSDRGEARQAAGPQTGGRPGARGSGRGTASGASTSGGTSSSGTSSGSGEAAGSSSGGTSGSSGSSGSAEGSGGSSGGSSGSSGSSGSAEGSGGSSGGSSGSSGSSGSAESSGSSSGGSSGSSGSSGSAEGSGSSSGGTSGSSGSSGSAEGSGGSSGGSSGSSGSSGSAEGSGGSSGGSSGSSGSSGSAEGSGSSSGGNSGSGASSGTESK